MKKRYSFIFSLLAFLLLIGLSANIQIYATEVGSEEANAAEAPDGDRFYKGKANGTVNVRLGPGEEYDKLKIDGKNVQVNRDTDITIIGEDTASSGKLWYHIQFEYNGAVVDGYSTSSYIDKDVLCTPTPTPIPSPTPTPEPTPTEIPEEPPAPTEAPVSEARQEKEQDLKMMIIIVAAVFVVLVVIIIIIAVIRRKRKKNDTEISGTVNKVKNLTYDESKRQGKKRQPEIRRLSDNDPVVEVTKMPVYPAEDDYEAYDDDYSDNATGNVLENASKEAEEKKALRAKIDALSEHDIVIHKYFGEGEVYDNSDVNLLEVRFDNDVRFLNKDSLVSKKLLEVPDTDAQIIAKRKNAATKIKRNQ